MTPMMALEPSATCAQMSSTTKIWLRQIFLELECEASIITISR